jgi:acyl-CoA thioester hydrolase
VAYPSVVDLGLQVMKLGKTSVLYEVGIFEQGQDTVKAVGGFIHVFVEQDSRRPAKEGMDPTIRDGLQQICTNKTAKL